MAAAALLGWFLWIEISGEKQGCAILIYEYFLGKKTGHTVYNRLTVMLNKYKCLMASG